MNKETNNYKETTQFKMIEQEIATSPILKSILTATPIAVNLWTADMISIMCNKYIRDIFGIEDEKEYLEKFYLFSPEFQPNGVLSSEMAKINFDKAIKDGINVFSWMHQTSKGKKVPSEITLCRLDGHGDKTFLAGFVRDLRGEFSQARSKTYDFYFTDVVPTNILLSEISSLSDEWFFSIDLRTGNLQQYMKALPVDNGLIFSLEAVKDTNFVHPDDMEKYAKVMENLSNGIYEPFDIRLMTKSGEYRYSRLVYKNILNSKDQPVFIIGKGVDVHEQKMLEERSQKDLLTNCYNKMSAEYLIKDKLAQHPEGNHVLFIADIDNFKSINDNFGHFFGDEVLKEIASGLRGVFRDADIVARIGGDEFTVFLENVSDMGLIRKKAENVLKIYSKTYSGEYKNYSISGSLGIAMYPKDGSTYDELYQNADKALYQAKLSGKNRCVIYSEDLNIGTMRSTTKIENADRIAGSFFDYELIGAVFNMLYEKSGDDSSIETALKFICQKYNADRCYIFETLDEGKTYDNTFEWCKAGVNSEINNLQELPADIFEDFIENAHNNVIYSNNLRETLEIDTAFETMAAQGIKSFVHAQIKKDGLMTFFIGLDDCEKARIWSEKEINSLQYIGKLISIILQGLRLNNKIAKLAESNKNSTHILDSTDEIIYISDIDTYDLLYLNRAAHNAVGNPPDEVWRNKKCYEVLQGLTEPCAVCTNKFLNETDFYAWSYYNELLDRTFLLKDKLIPFDGKLARLEIASDISKLTVLENVLQEKLDDERFLSNCVELLHSGDEPDIRIYKLLEEVTKYYNAERSYIFEVSEDKQFLSNTYEWCAENIEAFKDKLQNVPVGELGILYERCKQRITFSLYINEPAMAKDSLEYKLMEMQGLTRIILSPIISENGEVTGFVGIDNPTGNVGKTLVMQSVSKFIANFLDETALMAKLNTLSYYDSLTGVKNRQSFSDAVTRINKKHIDSLGVIYIDIKGLSAINDSKGVIYGDSILRKLAGILTDIYKQDVYRVGGDEFVVFNENSLEDDFENNIEKLKAKLQGEKDFVVTLGYTWNPNFNSNDDKEKYNGNEKYDLILSENLKLEIESGKYVVFLQPQVNLATNTVQSAEALVRRVGAGGVLQPPVSFIPFYEKEGIISRIDTFVLETVCKTLKRWRDLGKKEIKSVAVNCSRMTIAQKGIVETFSDICDKYGVNKAQIVIEITETTNAISEDVLKTIIQNFTNAGFAISLDDFGSGYSNLSSFVISDFDEVKIDMQIINDIHTNTKSKALTEVVLVLCDKLDGLVSVAEGVEYAQQHELLKDMGCAKGQGYYFDKPMPIDDFTAKYVECDE